MSNVNDFRAQFKDTTRLEDLKRQDRDIDNVNRKSDKEYADFLSIDDGINKFRIYPPHPNDTGNSFIESVQKWWLTFHREKKDKDGEKMKDRKGNPIIEDFRKTIFDARIHSEIKVDIIHEYITLLHKSLVDDGLTESEINEAMKLVYGSYNEKIQGIVGKPEWIMYASKFQGESSIFGRLSIGKAVKIRMNELIAIEETDKPIGTEFNNPFTNIDKGRLLIIKYNSKADAPTKYYTTELDASHDNDMRIKTYKLSKDDLEHFMKFPSLAGMYRNSYTQKDFAFALDGLKNFDDMHQFGVFESESFLSKCEELKDKYPKIEDGESPRSEENGKREVKKASTDEFDDMDIKQLREFSRENNTGIVVRSNMVIEKVREKLREWKSENMNKLSSDTKNESDDDENDLPWDKSEESRNTEIEKRLAKLKAELEGK